MGFIQVCWRIEASSESYKKHVPEFVFNYIDGPVTVIEPILEYAKLHIYDCFRLSPMCGRNIIGDHLSGNISVNGIVKGLWARHNKLITLQFILKMMLAGGYVLCSDVWLTQSRDVFQKKSADLVDLLCRSMNDTETVRGPVPRSVQFLNFRQLETTTLKTVEVLDYDTHIRLGQEYWVPLQTCKGTLHIVYRPDFMSFTDRDLREEFAING
jgi:hypothetical protein